MRFINISRLWRVYCQLRLNLPGGTKKRLPLRLRQPLVVVSQSNAVWAVDVMSFVRRATIPNPQHSG